ncbi:hypothetical protein [Bifidobacterium callitrichidarum]|uniref:Uncharacterized protein n=1 Tax=Bifidobacterium callitrichidarum TaxID=2052941 RepID=A0A2U2N939_9BIFI|nr:hypothetical protein [Bifidobacterium callitrichidarum]PWG65628.1 hypothetical protein DF196_06765 [Bifidobacterium callitrichidarum]
MQNATYIGNIDDISTQEVLETAKNETGNLDQPMTAQRVIALAALGFAYLKTNDAHRFMEYLSANDEYQEKYQGYIGNIVGLPATDVLDAMHSSGIAIVPECEMDDFSCGSEAYTQDLVWDNDGVSIDFSQMLNDPTEEDSRPDENRIPFARAGVGLMGLDRVPDLANRVTASDVSQAVDEFRDEYNGSYIAFKL